MITATLPNGEKVGLVFVHPTEEEDGVVSRSTVAQVRELTPEGKVNQDVCALTQGSSFCHPYDNFNKRVGRKLALTRALEDSFFEKNERTAIWAAYLDAVKDCKQSALPIKELVAQLLPQLKDLTVPNDGAIAFLTHLLEQETK